MVIDCEKAVQDWLHNNCIELDEEHKKLLAKAYCMDINENYRDEEIRYIYEDFFLSGEGELRSIQECKEMLYMED